MFKGTVITLALVGSIVAAPIRSDKRSVDKRAPIRICTTEGCEDYYREDGASNEKRQGPGCNTEGECPDWPPIEERQFPGCNTEGECPDWPIEKRGRFCNTEGCTWCDEDGCTPIRRDLVPRWRFCNTEQCYWCDEDGCTPLLEAASDAAPAAAVEKRQPGCTTEGECPWDEWVSGKEVTQRARICNTEGECWDVKRWAPESDSAVEKRSRHCNTEGECWECNDDLTVCTPIKHEKRGHRICNTEGECWDCNDDLSVCTPIELKKRQPGCNTEGECPWDEWTPAKRQNGCNTEGECPWDESTSAKKARVCNTEGECWDV